jgi:hypothetical protein
MKHYVLTGFIVYSVLTATPARSQTHSERLAPPSPTPESEPAADTFEPVLASEFEASSAEMPGAADVADASSLESQGELAIEARAFLDDDDAKTRDREVALVGKLQVDHPHAPFDERVRLIGRFDAFNQARGVLFVQEAWAQARFGPVRIRAGLDVLNWTATEAFHPADVINARNFDSDLENFEKLGEPMVSLRLGPWSGTTVSALFMPYYTRPHFPPSNSRMSLAPEIDFGGDLLVGRNGKIAPSRWAPQAALVLEQVLGSADFTLHVLEHMDRGQPLIGFDIEQRQVLEIFQTVRQVGATYQHVVGPFVLKLEGVYRRFQALNRLPQWLALTNYWGEPYPATRLPARDHAAVAVGLEYGIVHGGGAESTLVFEGEAIFGVHELIRKQLSVFQRDILIGYRLSLNNEEGSALQIATILDLDDPGETMNSVSYSQRIGGSLTLQVLLRIFSAKDILYGLGPLRRAHSLQLIVSRHF